MYEQILAMFQNLFHPSVSHDDVAAHVADAAAAIRAANDEAMADELARADAAHAADVAAGNDEYVRLNYYKKADFARYQTALAARVPDATGIKPWVNPEDFNTPEPTPEEWATFSPEKKALGHVDV